MAELHKFQDDVRSDTGRAKPIGARHLDENFRIVRISLSESLASFLYIKENFPQPDTLDFVVPPPGAESIPVFSGGQFSHWAETEEC